MATPLKRKAADVVSSSTKKPKANASITSFFSSPSTPAKPSGASIATSPPSSSPAALNQDEVTKPVTSTTPTASIFNVGTAAGPQFSAAAATPKFDKSKWLEKLTQEQKDLLALEIETLDESWLAHLKDDILSKDFLQLKRFLKSEHEAGKKIFPPAADVYSWYAEAYEARKRFGHRKLTHPPGLDIHLFRLSR